MSARTKVASIPSSVSAQADSPLSKNQRAPRCTFSTSDNRHCTMLRHDSHPSFCLFHARKERILLESDRIGPELAPPSGKFHSFTDLNESLTQLWNLLAADRISRKRAATLGYVASLIFPTIVHVANEASIRRNNQRYEEWKKSVARTFPPRQAAPAPQQEK
jgi:hypothetical protein